MSVPVSSAPVPDGGAGRNGRRRVANEQEWTFTSLEVSSYPWRVLDDLEAEWLWLPIIGPTSMVLWRRLVYWCSLGEPSVTVDRQRLAAVTGVPGTRVAQCVQRLVDFHLLVPHPQGELLGVLTRAPVPTEGQARRLPADMQALVESLRHNPDALAHGLAVDATRVDAP